MSDALSEERAAGHALTFRHATIDDFALVRRHYALVHDAHAANMPEMFRRMEENDFSIERFRANLVDDNLLLIAEDDGKPVGSVLASCHQVGPGGYLPGRSVFIHYVVTEPEMRGRGVATALIAATSEWAAERQAYRINLVVWRFNSDALALYRKLGFADAHVGLAIAPSTALGRHGGGRLPKRPAAAPPPEARPSRLRSWLFRR